MSTAKVATEGSWESVCLCVCLPSHRERRVRIVQLPLGGLRSVASFSSQ